MTEGKSWEACCCGEGVIGSLVVDLSQPLISLGAISKVPVDPLEEKSLLQYRSGLLQYVSVDTMLVAQDGQERACFQPLRSPPTATAELQSADGGEAAGHVMTSLQISN